MMMTKSIYCYEIHIYWLADLLDLLNYEVHTLRHTHWLRFLSCPHLIRLGIETNSCIIHHSNSNCWCIFPTVALHPSPIPNGNTLSLTASHLRKILNLDSKKLMSFKFAALVKLLYRDNLKQKHQSRARLHQEIKDKAVKRDAVTCPSKTKRVETTPLAEMLLAHLQAVTCLRLRSVIDIVFNTRNTLQFTTCWSWSWTDCCC